MCFKIILKIQGNQLFYTYAFMSVAPYNIQFIDFVLLRLQTKSFQSTSSIMPYINVKWIGKYQRNAQWITLFGLYKLKEGKQKGDWWRWPTLELKNVLYLYAYECRMQWKIIIMQTISSGKIMECDQHFRPLYPPLTTITSEHESREPFKLDDDNEKWIGKKDGR